ncbi:non-ribosomal peptide synthetase [Carnobacterium inhibens]|uniref:non-ribosomal peptide synthetase n=1 Tax=Carnobacterium inhibens TaxID=147709 RepID=UPI0005515D08|nr:non-ribosomal peptide synthetase [Carnobacterium inhibens]
MVKNIVAAFEEQVIKTPNQVAVEFGEESLTYYELNCKSNSLAYYLVDKCGIKNGDIIPLLLDRNEKIIIAMLGVLKAGACYTALSKQYPKSRISFVQEQTEAKLLIDDEFITQKFKKHQQNLNISISQDDLAYIVYTSGTTGNPKGVLHTHKGVFNHINSYWKYLNFDSTIIYNTLFLVNYVFSVATTQIYSTILHGHKLIISEPNCLENIQKFTDYINRKNINYFQCTPSLADSLDFKKIESVKTVAVAGEKIPESLFYNTYNNNVKLINVYGQSEFHAGTAKTIDSIKDINNIGSNLENMNAYVLDENLSEVGIGQIGEIHMAGDQLSLGYLKLEDETKKHFISNPFGEGILCRTGDLVKNLNNREFEFVGRNDFQLNINGIRTEPGEIEVQIVSIPEVQKAVVVGINDQFIVAYYVSHKKLEEVYIKSYITKNLSEYMQPHIYIWMEQLPLNVNGKLDRKRLPEVNLQTEEYIAPITNTEKVIIESIESLLGIDNVSILDNFFHLGGNSLKAMQLSNIIFNKIQKKLTAKEIFSSQQIKDLVNLVENLDEIDEIQLVPILNKSFYSMSPVQKRMYVFNELNKEDISYNEQTVIDFLSKVDALKMQNALEQMIRRHESLRTKFSNIDGQYIQEVMPEGQLDFQIIPYTKEISNLVKPMNLKKGQTMRVYLLCGEQNDSLFIDKHHIITDGTSEKIFYQELNQLYRGDKLESNNFHYRDYSSWFAQLNLKKEKKWWTDYLLGYQRLELVTDYKKMRNHNASGSTLKVSFESDLVKKIRAFAKENKVSEYMIIFATISLLLSKMYNSEDFILGTVSNGRVHEATDKMLGMFVNTLPIRLRPYSNLKASKFLNQINEDVLTALSNQNYQFEEIIKDLQATSDLGNPFFDCMYVYQNIEKDSYFDGKAKKNSFKSDAAKFSLTFEIEDSELGMDLFLNYDNSLFETQTIEKLVNRFMSTTENYINNPEEKLSDISIFAKGEKTNLLEVTSTLVHENVIELFEKQVKLRPDDLALRFENVILSYSALNEEVNKVANFLIEEMKVQPEQKIPLLLHRTHKTVIAILAVLKAGAAYVPVSLKYPQERIDYIIDVCDSNFVIDDNFMNQSFSSEVSNPENKIELNQLAYIIFTSGTSGTPKGVMVTHKNLGNFVIQVAKMEKSGMQTGMVNGAFFEYVFDASIHDLIRPFTMGESVVILDTDLIYDIDLLIQTLIRYKVNAIGMTPSLAAKLNLKSVPTMQVLHCGGEAITMEVIEKYADSSIQLNNCYGPTETTVLCFVNNDVTDLSIGKPIGGVNPYVLDNNHHLLPKGAIGTLFIGENQVTRGYINQPEETTKRYIDNPFGKGQLYDTGDLVRVLNNGTYEYLGRKDFQVKIRGFRVELSEIEKSFQSIEGIDQVAVIAKQDNLGAYYVAQNKFDSEFLFDQLSKILPEYMIPTFYVHLKEFPLTINGKLDVQTLPEPVYTDEYVAPKTKREKEIESAFCQVLGLNKVSIKANFFRLGGNSIVAISLANLINLSVKDIFERKTIQNLAKVNEEIRHVEKQIFENIKDQNLSYAQERLFFIDQLEEGTQAYNIPILGTLSKDINYQKLEEAIQKVVNRHEILRTIIVDFHQELLNKNIKITHNEIEFNEFFSYSFDLEKEIPIRVNIFRNMIAINVHHIAFDGWSTNILLEEITRLYNGENLAPLEIQYKDFAKWQITAQDEATLNEQEKYWLEKLDGYETLDFPTDFSRPQQFNYDGQELNYKLDKNLIEKLNKVARNHDTSLYCVTLSAFMLLLSAYSNQKDIVLGTPIANRHIKGTENMIGLFVNTLALRSQVNPNESFAEFLETNSEQITAAQKYQDLPFERLVNKLKVEKDLSRNPIFQIMFGFQDIENIKEIDLFTSVNNDLHLNSTKFDISVMHRENIVNFTFATKLFKEETIQGIAETYEKILKQIAEEPEKLISQIELNSMIVNTQKENFPNLSIHKFFETVVTNYPKNSAIVYEGKILTYESLNQKANQFAHTLIDNYGIKPEMHIPILMERSEKYVIAILGILKTGASYVPMSLEYPQERIKYIIEKVNAPLIITDNFIVNSKNINNPSVSILENNLAYIIFTSGTTGLPKGVMIEHRGVINTIYNQIKLYDVNESTRAIHFANFVFDASVFELFYTLLAGATSYLLNEEARTDYNLLKQIIIDNQITLATLPPAILSAEDLLPLKTLIVAGESTPQEIYQSYTANKVIMVNAYGPTEVTVCATVKFYNQNMNSNNIGKALKNVVTYVLDSENHQVPTNAIGELYVGGAGLARGYVGDNEKTNKAFIWHPQYGRLYKTGDLVKRLQTGDLIYIGRNDFQVKVRGFRIELGEIEAKLLEQETVSQCLAVVKGNNIIAYYTGDLQYSLEGILPSYMVPSGYVQIDEIPLTINGKVDFHKLPDPIIEYNEYVEPSTKREKEISKAFCDLLNLSQVSVLDDFYALGGNSILALKLAKKINLQVKQIFEAKNIRALAKLQSRTLKLKKANFENVEDQVLSFAQERLWFIDQFEKGLNAYNIPLILQLAEGISIERIEQSILQIVERHEILRTIIKNEHQVILSEKIKITHSPFDVNEFFSKPFDLEHEIPIRVNIYDNQLVLNIHHIAFDGWSTELLLRELNMLYNGEELPSLNVQYKDFSYWQRNYLSKDLLELQSNYWKETLDSYEPLNLPVDYERPKEFTYSGSDICIDFKGEWKESLEKIAKKNQTSLYTIMLSVLDIMLARFSYQQDIVVGTPFANRHNKGTEDLIGFFINTLPVRTVVDEKSSFTILLQQNHKTIIDAQNNQDISFEQIVKKLSISQDTSRNPIFQVLFSVQDFSMDELTNNDLFAGCNTDIFSNSAKYDLSVLVENGFINFNYCTDLFNESTVQSMVKTYVSILEAIIENDNLSVSELGVSDSFAKGEISNYPDGTVVDLFNEQVSRTPNQIAIEYKNTRLTYNEFNKRTNRFANYLLTHGANQGDKIPMILERSEKMAIAIWGILKAGCAYVPISPEFPEERKQYIIDQINAKFIIDETFAGYNEGSEKNPNITPSMKDIAYIIFTSGTTGKPKGVMIEHASLSNRVQWMNGAYPIGDMDKVYQKTNYVFDVSVWEQVWPLLTGASIVYAIENGHKDSIYLSNEIKEKCITVVHFVPSMLDVFLDTLEIYQGEPNSKKLDISSLKYVFCSGEALNISSVKKFKKLVPNAQIYNLYGPTEASIDVTSFDCNSSVEKILIGKPIANTKCYVLSKSNQLLPKFAIGELAIGGVQLARGYINQPELTVEKFLTHSKLGRVYKTGDLVRLLDTGEIEYLGRNDFQVKIHGLRIELGEIESKLSEIGGVQQVVVLKVEERLVAYYLGDQPLSEDSLKEKLEEKLPGYMVPSNFVFMEKFPLTINGKLNRRAFPVPKIKIEEFVQPENEVEVKIQEIVSEILGLKSSNVNVLESFFYLGGDSIKAMQLSNRIKQKLNQTITIKQIFDAKTVRNISLLIGKSKKMEIINEQGELTGEVRLLPIQEWFFEEYNSGYFNQAFAISLPEGIDLNRLKKALINLINYHDAFRISFREIKQYYTPKIEEIELVFAETPEEFSAIQQSFNLDGKLYRFVIKRSENILAVICHHLIMDSVSWQIIASDLKRFYEGDIFPEKGTSYRQWSEEIQKRNTDFVFVDFNNYNQLFELSDKYKKVNISIDREFTNKLLTQVNQVYNTQVNDVLLTAFARALKSIYNQKISYIKLESHGRAEVSENINIQQTVGWFTAIYPQTISTDILETKHYTNVVKDYGIGYGTKFGIHSKDLPRVMFNYLGQMDNGALKEWSIVHSDLGETTDFAFNDYLTVNGGIFKKKLTFELSGKLNGIEKFAELYQTELENIITELSSYRRTYLTSDDIDQVVSQQQLDELQKNQELEIVLPANTLQEGFVSHALNNDTNDDAYICSFIFDYEQMINVENYRKAWSIAQSKYPSLRLSLNTDYGEILQIIPKKGKLDFGILEDTSVDEVVKFERTISFDLNAGSLFRVRLIKHNENHYTCILTNHHAILDGWSNPVMLNFVHEVYAKLCKGERIYINEDKAYIKSQKYLEQTKNDSNNYWKNYLGEVAHPDLGGLFKKESRTTKLENLNRIEEPKDKVYEIQGDEYTKLIDIARNKGLTLNIIAQYAWHKLLSVYGGIKETTIGVVNAGRSMPIEGIEESVGLYIRTLPIQFVHTNDPILTQLLHLQNINNECMMNNNVSLARLQSNGMRLFDTLFIYENYPLPEEDNNEENLKITNLTGQEKLDYPLTIVLHESKKSLSFHMKYAGELFSEETIDQMFNFMKYLVDQVVQDVEEFNYVDSVPDFGVSEYPNTTIVEEFEKQVRLYPDEIALKSTNVNYSFAELNSKANQVAYTLMENFDIKSGDRISLLLSKSEKMIVAILGILKAGAVYVPMSPNFPHERINYIKEQVKSKLLIDEKFMNQEFSQNVTNLNISVQSDDLAYIIFTSGTTGHPKGVMVEHRNFICYLENVLISIQRTGTDKIDFACISEYVFDIFGTEVFGQLLRGKPVNLFTGTPEEFPNFMKNHYVTTLQSTPGKISYLFQDNDKEILSTSLTTILVGGEKMNDSFVKRFGNINLINIYGPTEGTVWTSLKKVDDNYSNIGNPFQSYSHFILDDKMRLLPNGAIGELYVGGPQLSRGYYGQEDLTESTFVKNPYNIWGLTEYSRIYKTGDVVRVLLNGEFELIGRNDFQVKIRGFRIELGEIENAMLKVNGVKQVLALALGEEGSKYLGVYYQSDKEIPRVEIEKVLSRYLTDYMMPAGYQHVKEFPLTINGKIDRRTLPIISYKNGVEYIAPRNEVEQLVLQTICKLLEINTNEVSVLESFFAIGGDSIKVIKLVNILKKEFDKKITIKEIFDVKTTQEIAQVLQNKVNYNELNKLTVSKQDFFECSEQKLSFAQQKYMETPLNSYSNIKMFFRLKEGIEAERLKQAVISTVNRHEVLRTKLYDKYQIVDDTQLVVTSNKIDRTNYFSYSFDLKKEIPIKVNIYEGEFTCVIDHIAFDGWSTSLFLEDIEDFYFEKGLPELPYQYKDFSKCQHDFLSGDKKEPQLEYWRKEFGKFEGIYLSKDENLGVDTKKGGDIYLHLNDDVYEKMIRIVKERGLTLHNVLLSTYYLMVAHVSQQKNISIAIPTVNRNISGTENLIGLFINQFLLTMTIDGNQTFVKFVEKLNAKIIAAQSNQDIPLEQVIKEIGIKLKGNTLYFGIQGFKGEALKQSNLFDEISEMNQLSEKDAFSDLTIFVWGQNIDFNYSKSLFQTERVQYFADIYEKILKKLINNIDIKIEELI